jgi:hypothetical protein
MGLKDVLGKAKARGLSAAEISQVTRTWMATGGLCEFCRILPGECIEYDRRSRKFTGLLCRTCTTEAEDIEEQQS